ARASRSWPAPPGSSVSAGSSWGTLTEPRSSATSPAGGNAWIPTTSTATSRSVPRSRSPSRRCRRPPPGWSTMCRPWPRSRAVTLLAGLDVALEMIEEEGLERVLARHDLLARATRAGAAALGLELFGDPDERATVVTAIELPETIEGGKVPGLLRRRGITANG